MIPRFSLARPASLDEAFAAHRAAEGEGAYYAGGTELLQVMKMGLGQFRRLIDLKRIPELQGIGLEPGGVIRIGATSTHREVEHSELLGEELPGLVALERDLANVRVRNQGTLGGNLAFAEPHSDPATFLLACGARVELAGPQGRREVPVGEFVVAPLLTSREPDEILVSVRVPRALPGEGRGYARARFFERPAVSVAVRLAVRDGQVADATVAVGSMTEVPTLVPAAADALRSAEAEATALGEVVARAGSAFDDVDAVDDLNGSSDYKRALAGVLLARAAGEALADARRIGRDA